VGSFAELVNTPFAHGLNAVCWPRPLPGDFAEVAARIEGDEPIITLDETRLRALTVGAAGRIAIEVLLADLQLLRDRNLDPVLNCINGYPRDDTAGVLPTDVFSFHADRAPVEAYTYLCTYHGPSSEGLRNADARRRIDDPATRAALLREYGGNARRWLPGVPRRPLLRPALRRGSWRASLFIWNRVILAHRDRISRLPRAAVRPPRTRHPARRAAPAADQLKPPWSPARASGPRAISPGAR
jgi:hypothetical protein